MALRTDVDLNQKWWHRFFKVAGIAGLGILILGTAVRVYNAPPDFSAGGSLILDNLEDYTKKADPKVNSVAGFLGSPGRLGEVAGPMFDKVEPRQASLLHGWFCSSDPIMRGQLVVDDLNRFLDTRITAGADSPAVQSGLEQMFPGQHPSVCYRYRSPGTPWLEPKNIVKYDPAAAESAGQFRELGRGAVNVGVACGAGLALYRVFLYIVLGPRRQQPGS